MTESGEPSIPLSTATSGEHLQRLTFFPYDCLVRLLTDELQTYESVSLFRNDQKLNEA